MTFLVVSYIIATFVGGFGVLALEMLGSRLLGPYYGNSTYVWGGLLGVIMVALAAGYYVGGWLADKKKDPPLVFDFFLYASHYLIGVLFLYKKLLPTLTSAGIIWGSILSSAILLGPPMLLLAMVSPVVIKLLAKEETVGITAGKISAISTLGSIFGTFVTAFGLIPSQGTFTTLTLVTISLLTMYIVGAFSSSKPILRVITGAVLIGTVLLIPKETNAGNIIFRTESPYNIIMVGRKGNETHLYLNDLRWIQSRYYEGYLSTGGYIDFLLVGKRLADLKDLLILGGGGGASIRQFLFFAPQVNIDAVEIDPKVVQAGKDYFHLPDDPRLKMYIEDGRTFLNRQQKKYDFIEVDIFAGGGNVPFYLATREYFQLIINRLNPSGVMALNIISNNGKKTLAYHVGNTIASVFPSVYSLDLQNNMLFIATKDKSSIETLLSKLNADQDDELSGIMQYAAKILEEYKPQNGFAVFTDDLSPIERVTFNMLKGENTETQMSMQ